MSCNKSAGAGGLNVRANLLRQHTREQSHLNGVGQHVFAVAVAVLQAAKQANQLGVKSADANFKGSLFAGAPDGFVNVADGAVDTLFDAGRVVCARL